MTEPTGERFIPQLDEALQHDQLPLQGEDVRLVAERQQALSELSRLRRDLEIARSDRAHVAALLLAAEQQVAMLLHEMSDAARMVRQLQQEVTDLRSSTSWRATALLRFVTGALRRTR